ncbi:hypothetical protein AAGG74_16545 [Bacillus mexicanus]|uniref:hypothetical protein n=1 Tax=Bacillus mexicanus TaxID=2834415 RepID=UPI003D196AAF
MPPFKYVSYMIDSTVKKILIQMNKLRGDEKQIKNTLIANCPFELTEVSIIHSTGFGYEIELYRSNKDVCSANPKNIIYIKL